MGRATKILLMTLLLLLVLGGASAEMPPVRNWLGGLDLTLYLRLVAIAGLMIAVFTAWGFKQKVVASQKFQRAKTVLSAAEATAARNKDALAGLEEKLRNDYAKREHRFQEELEKLTKEHQEQILALKEHNMQLKDAAVKLMGALKRKSARGA
jgi:hypothetical protein